MGKIHELLAVEGDLKAEAQRTLNRVKGLFDSGQGKFVGKVRKYQPLDEGGETFADEVTELATTVPQELMAFCAAYGRWMDAAVQKEVSNRSTGADVEIDGKAIIKNLPAPALLNLESKLAEIRHIFAAIPTNDPTERWANDEQNNRWISSPRITYRTKKVPRSFEASPATKEHPAQVTVFQEDERVGTWEQVIYSGMLTPKDKQERLERLDNLARAVKQARQRANDTEANSDKVSNILFDYINGE